ADLERTAEDGGLHRQGRIGGEPEVAARPVDRQGTKAGRGDPVLLPVDARRLLVGDLVHAVVRGRVRGRVVRDRPGRIEAGRAEDRRGRGVDHALDLAGGRARDVEDVRGADDVDRGAARRVLPAERDLPGGEVDHAA